MDPTWIVRLDAAGDGPRLAVKDCIDVEGLPTTAGCQLIAEQASPAARDAAVVAAARRAGARIVGKTNLAELCWSASGVNPWSGTPVNPADPRRIPGGSSSGSAVAVAAGEADVALGTDTGGSVRIPAACCAIVGLKTTWGRVPVDGVYPLAPSFDTVGPLGADMAAVELGMRLIEPGFAAGSCELAVGRIRPDIDIDPVTDAAVDGALAAAGLRVADVAGFDFRGANSAGNVLIDVAAYQANAHLIPQLDRLSPQIRRNMTEAAEVTADQRDAASRTRLEVRDWFTAMLDRHPFLAMPTLAGPPPLLGERGMSLTVLTMPANLAGLPALALPIPGGPAGLPASLQLIGPLGGEEQLIALGRVVEASLGARGLAPLRGARIGSYPGAGKNDLKGEEPPMSAPAETQTWPELRGFLHGLPGVDRVGAEARAAMLASRSIKTTAKQWALDAAISMIDLTTLEGQDTPGKVRALCAKAKRPDPADPTAPMVAAVCVYPDLAHVAAAELKGSGVHVASVATAFPSGRTSLDVKLADVKYAVAAGADEVDMVIDRGAFLAGRYQQVFDEIVAVREACDGAHLKVILETGELVTLDNVRRASWLAMLAGADFIKTSTGKVAPAATLPVTLVMLEAVRDFREARGRQVGVKPAGGIRTAKDALRYLVLVNETAGEDWLDPRWFRLGASSLLNDLLMQRTKMATGRYSGPDYFTLD